MSATPTSIWTAERLQALPADGRRYEIIDGELLVSPAPTDAHQRGVRWLTRLLDGYLGSREDLAVLGSPAAVHAGRLTSVQPDICVLPTTPSQRAAPELGALLLAIEVLSPETARIDRQEKRRLYQRAGVPVYWIVDLHSHLVERWRPDDQRPEILTHAVQWKPPGVDQPLVIYLAELFAEALDGG